MRKSLLVLAWLLPVSAFRADTSTNELEKTEEIPNQWAAAPAVHLAEHDDGPLIPDLVPPMGEEYTLQSRKRVDLFVESNAYQWVFASRTSKLGHSRNVGQVFGELEGSSLGNIFGKRRTTVMNSDGEPLFHIELAKNNFNPTRVRWSWRIRNTVTEKIMFTINKDIIGGGLLWLRDEWRVYKGRMHDDNQIYFVVGGYFGYDHYFHKSKADWKDGVAPIGISSQSATRSFIGAPPVYEAKVSAGEDGALQLATTVIINMVHETEEAEQAAEERAQQSSHKSSYKSK